MNTYNELFNFFLKIIIKLKFLFIIKLLDIMF